MKRYAVQLLPREKYDLGDEEITTTATTTIANAKNGEENTKKTKTNTTASSVYAHWKSEALKINHHSGPPDHRHVPMYTPPIPGFDVNMYADKEDEDK